ncbi:MAG TPA: bifunctional UDP-N-acetylglucosamine diphosphorylase/glucosamine-1-phosphate N-acetyltransferase GlmU [Terriglobales bacterium]|jgi:bifunctional UDP-N-acetylglucosamine pyrophosphorylase/glucosamine-1-phosphate N-acetyltransferase|nr:bifunctional UDP-N-acetylglucosamine diphosphorylase/glucosamine-1-phosphate N-acetyltransferase GlmU [Terriglobales bacterium]
MTSKRPERTAPPRGISLKPKSVAIAIMAAGKGTRLKSKHPKVLHEVGGKPLLAHVIAAASRVLPAEDVYVIIGHEAERVREATRSTGVNFVRQEPQRGTGHALMCAAPSLSAYDHVVVLSGDAPLIRAETISGLLQFHLQRKAAMTILSAKLEVPTGYGRILRKGKTDEVQAVVEEKSCTPAQRKLQEINSGFYAFSVKALFDNIKRLTTANAHGEYYLTDMAEVLRRAKQRVVATPVENPSEILGSNTRAELVELDRSLRREKALSLMAAGVTIFYPDTCLIDVEVEAGPDTVIEPFVQLLGHTKIGTDCRIRSYSVILNSEIGDGVLVRPGCVLENARVASGALLGPYSHLRPGSDIGEGAHVGNFVETKKVKLGRGSKANHLTYLGDAEIGAGVNVGAGTITCNYDGVHKHMTVIEDGVFVGSDSTLVAPLKLGKGSYVAAGSCITDDVPEESLALGRSRQIVKEQWAKKKRAITAKN